jgi:hypothetical protein
MQAGLDSDRCRLARVALARWLRRRRSVIRALAIRVLSNASFSNAPAIATSAAQSSSLPLSPASRRRSPPDSSALASTILVESTRHSPIARHYSIIRFDGRIRTTPHHAEVFVTLTKPCHTRNKIAGAQRFGGCAAHCFAQPESTTAVPDRSGTSLHAPPRFRCRRDRARHAIAGALPTLGCGADVHPSLQLPVAGCVGPLSAPGRRTGIVVRLSCRSRTICSGHRTDSARTRATSFCSST